MIPPLHKPPGEFDLIARYFKPLAAREPGALGLGDDAAVLDPPPGRQVVVTTDTEVAGIHFLPTDPPASVAVKLLGVNLSDLAAMGARPWVYTLNTAWPRGVDETWISAFCDGLAGMQKRHAITLVGGDTVATDGELVLTVTALGLVETGRALRRNGARVGDGIYVSGTIGDGALGLVAATGGLGEIDRDARDALIDRYRHPRPRNDLGCALVGVASAAIDVSDGLLADLGHLCAQSKAGALIEVERVPLSSAARAAVSANGRRMVTVLTGGDDYELLFTASAPLADELAGTPVRRIGTVTAGEGVRALDAEGREMVLSSLGYRHF